MSKKTETITLDEWISAAFKQLPNRPDNAFTMKEACDKSGMNKRTMQTRLENLVADGKLVKGKCYEDGRIINYYIPAELIKKK